MAEQTIDLTKGGVAVVMIGNTGMVKEFANDARVRFIDCKQTPGDMLESLVPENTKLIIITDGLPQWHSTWVFAYAKRRGILYLIRKSNQAIYETLKLAFKSDNGSEVKPSVEEVKDTQVKGKLVPLFQFIDYSKSNAENAKVLLRKAHELNIKTTEASLAQVVAIQRRKLSGGTVPKSARPKLDVLVEMFDNMIKEMSDMRDFIIDTVEENKVLRAKVDKFKKVMEE